MYRHIVVATDGSELAMGAVGHAVDIARVFSATLTIVTVVDTLPVVDLGGLVISPSTFDQMRQATLDRCAEILRQAKEIAGPGAKTVTIERLAAYEGILDVVKSVDADLVVMGSHGRNILSRLILGSQASKVVNLSEVPVLIVKERKPGTADAARQ
jgi:nucleotide-binding universal stress UspA family protein